MRQAEGGKKRIEAHSTWQQRTFLYPGRYTLGKPWQERQRKQAQYSHWTRKAGCGYAHGDKESRKREGWDARLCSALCPDSPALSASRLLAGVRSPRYRKSTRLN